VDGNNPGASTFGETFVIHSSDALAQNLSFYVRPYYPGTAPQLCTFQVYIMGWSGSRPTGSVLFASAALTPPSPQVLSISLGNTFLKRDQKYVAFFTSDNFMDGIRSDAAMAAVPNAYADGAIVVSYSDPNFNAMFTHDWATIFDPQYDLGFKLDYQPIPEPSTCTLIALGMTGLLATRRRRTRTKDRMTETNRSTEGREGERRTCTGPNGGNRETARKRLVSFRPERSRSVTR